MHVFVNLILLSIGYSQSTTLIIELYTSVVTQLSRSLTAFLALHRRFSYGSSGFPLVGGGSHPPHHPSALSVVELYMYSLLTFPVAFKPCPRATLVSLVSCVIALIPSCSACILFIRHYSRDFLFLFILQSRSIPISQSFRA